MLVGRMVPMTQAHPISGAIPELLSCQADRIGLFGSGAKVVTLARMATRHGFRVRASEDPRDLRDAALVIEATGDDLETKRRALSNLEGAIDEDAILATETAMLSVSALAAGTARPERIVGIHVVRSEGAELVEIIRALQTSDAAHRAARRILRAFGQSIVCADDRAGFLVFRLLIPVINEACFALQEGLATVEDIDRAARLGSNSPGPLRTADSIGLDHCLAAAEHLQRQFGDAKYRAAPLLRNYVAASWLGKKTLRGFYSYTAG
jgi:3-hydroxybutyryl-CoA dehydrogenase